MIEIEEVFSPFCFAIIIKHALYGKINKNSIKNIHTLATTDPHTHIIVCRRQRQLQNDNHRSGL